MMKTSAKMIINCIKNAEHVDDLKQIATGDLIDFYNAHAKSPVKRFRDRKAAEQRVVKLAVQLNQRSQRKPPSKNTKTPKKTSGRRIRELIKQGVDPVSIIDDYIRKEFPDSRASTKDVYWHRSMLKKLGEIS